jgi:hypothetical protein
MSIMSAAGQQLLFPGFSPKWADLSFGYTYAVVLSNNTGADVTDGTFTIQDTKASDADPCLPDDALWADIPVEPECDALPGSVVEPAIIRYTPEVPLPNGAQCQYAVPCVRQFLRVVASGGAGVDSVTIVARLKRTGFQGIQYNP